MISSGARGREGSDFLHDLARVGRGRRQREKPAILRHGVSRVLRRLVGASELIREIRGRGIERRCVPQGTQFRWTVTEHGRLLSTLHEVARLAALLGARRGDGSGHAADGPSTRRARLQRVSRECALRVRRCGVHDHAAQRGGTHPRCDFDPPHDAIGDFAQCDYPHHPPPRVSTRTGRMRFVRVPSPS